MSGPSSSPHGFEPFAVAEKNAGAWTARLVDTCIWCGQPEAAHPKENVTMHTSCTLGNDACEAFDPNALGHCAGGHPKDCHEPISSLEWAARIRHRRAMAETSVFIVCRDEVTPVG